MARELACMFPQAMDAIDAANEAFSSFSAGLKPPEPPHLKLSDRIYPPSSSDSTKKQSRKKALQSTRMAQPAIGAVSLGMIKILEHFGITPDAACGHSFGELTALASAGWISHGRFSETVRCQRPFHGSGRKRGRSRTDDCRQGAD